MASSNKLNKALWTNMTKLKLLSKEDEPVRFVLDQSPFGDDDDESASVRDVYVIIGRIFPKSELFKDHALQIEMKLTDKYPIDPPEVRILTRIYHPNVDTDGKFCHALLTKTARWKSGTTLVQVVKAIVEHIDQPDIDYAVNIEIGKEYMENRPQFDRKALEMIQKNGLPRNSN